MKKIICLMSLLGIFALPYGCESYQSNENIQRQEDQQDPAVDQLDTTASPQPAKREFPEKGGSAR